MAPFTSVQEKEAIFEQLYYMVSTGLIKVADVYREAYDETLREAVNEEWVFVLIGQSWKDRLLERMDTLGL